jgi:hypothetical protein
MRWLLPFLLIRLVPENYYNRPMASKPSGAAVALCAILSALSMAAAVYFGGTGRTPIAMAGTLLFVILGGLAFELARRRSV